jgi:hypothetical protein
MNKRWLLLFALLFPLALPPSAEAGLGKAIAKRKKKKKKTVRKARKELRRAKRDHASAEMTFRLLATSLGKRKQTTRAVEHVVALSALRSSSYRRYGKKLRRGYRAYLEKLVLAETANAGEAKSLRAQAERAKAKLAERFGDDFDQLDSAMMSYAERAKNAPEGQLYDEYRRAEGRYYGAVENLRRARMNGAQRAVDGASRRLGRLSEGFWDAVAPHPGP